MIPEAIQRLVEAVLYEGHVLYPYRASALKNRQRWAFGGLFPQAYVAAQGGDPCRMQVQCLLSGAHPPLSVRLRFLQVVARQAGRLEGDGSSPAWAPVPMIEVDGRPYVSWEEALEREVELHVVDVSELPARPRSECFSFDAARDTKWVRDAGDRVAGVLVRSREALSGTLEVLAEPAGAALYLLTVRVTNETPLEHGAVIPRAAAHRCALASAHVLLAAPGARFISMTDPPPAMAAAVAACRNDGAWPVLAGEPGQAEWMLASPIILYDYPQIAPESRGDLYDGTEIDEILSLRVMALGEEEQREVAAVDERARALLARTAAMTPPQWRALHGAFRESPPADGPRLPTIRPPEAILCVGARVRLHPRRDGDVMDLALAGRTGVIEGIESDFEDRMHVAVTLDDDPGHDLGLARMPGHRFFFAPDELALIEEAAGA